MGRKPGGANGAKGSDGLTDKQRLFTVKYFLNGGERIRAARESYPNYNSQQALVAIAAKNLKLPAVKAFLALLGKAKHDAQEGSTEGIIKASNKILEILDTISDTDIINVLPPDTEEYKTLATIDPKYRKTISAIKITTRKVGDLLVERVFELKLWDKMKALELNGKHYKMYTDVQQINPITKPEVYVPDSGRNKPTDEQ